MVGGIGNILSLLKVKDQYRVTYISTNGNNFVVHKSNGSVGIFKESPHRQYYYDTSHDGINDASEHNTIVVTVVADNASQYSSVNYTQALWAQKVQKIIGWCSTHDFMKLWYTIYYLTALSHMKT